MDNERFQALSEECRLASAEQDAAWARDDMPEYRAAFVRYNRNAELMHALRVQDALERGHAPMDDDQRYMALLKRNSYYVIK